MGDRYLKTQSMTPPRSDRATRERSELVQIAAVAIAMITDMDSGSTRLYRHTVDDLTEAHRRVMHDILLERISQEEKQGVHHHSPTEWAMILCKEIGEWADEMVEIPKADALWDRESAIVTALLRRLIHDGTQARSWLEHHAWPEAQQAVFDLELGGRP